MKSPLSRFVLATIAWLPVTFALWYLAAPLLFVPVEAMVALVGKTAFGDIVRSVSLDGTALTIDTTLRPGQTTSGGRVAVEVNPLLYSFGLPMFAALVLAAREPGWAKRLVLGVALVLPFVAFGVLADFLKDVAITASPLVASQTGFSAGQREAIAFAYQFGTLILPTVVPAALWVLMHRRFLERLQARDPAAARP